MYRRSKLLAGLFMCALLLTTGSGIGQTRELEGEIIVYHAGSLTIPFQAIENEFENCYPRVDVKRTPGGSRKISLMVAELGNRVDVLASADYKVIDTLIMPDHASWNTLFAKNSMVIMYTDDSRYADEINANNWYDTLLRQGVKYGHADPDLDPCGYRTVLLWQLAGHHYGKEDLYKKLCASCPERNIRPKSVELISLLETRALDYAFEYESVARQHVAENPGFKYVRLPDRINLSSMQYAGFYETASIELKGKKPGETVIRTGEPIIYSLTMPSTGENTELAVEFLKFFFTRGLRILEDHGQPVLEPVQTKGAENLPVELKNILR